MTYLERILKMFNAFQDNLFQKEHVYDIPLIDEYFKSLCIKSPSLDKAIKVFGNNSIKDFILNTKTNILTDCSKSEDLRKIVFDYVEPLLGSEIALQTIDALDIQRTVLTANHHGVDYFAQSAQGTMLFTIMLKEKNANQRAIPVIACANISLNNLTYPRGILLYGLKKNNINKIPYKIPLFPDKDKTKTVCNLNPIKKENIQIAIKNVSNLFKSNMISSTMYKTVIEVLENDYLSELVLSQKSYSDQAVIINYNLWKKIFRENLSDINVVYLSLEDIALKLIEKDLYKVGSLLHIILFDTEVREKIISGLYQSKACWDKCIFDCEENYYLEKKYSGTHFFWGSRQKRKKIFFVLKKE